jgi:acetyltransferase-like isoleucine patch superfamily enzyme
VKNPLICIKNIIRIAFLRAEYGNRLHIGWIQTFDRVRFEIGKNAEVNIGSFNQNREKMYVGVKEEGKLVVGSHCFFNINSSITCIEKIEIGDNCKFGNNLVMVDHDHNFRAKGQYSADSTEFISSPITIGNNVWVGANVVILRGTTIGDNCVIGAGSIVKGNIPSDTIYVKGEKRRY